MRRDKVKQMEQELGLTAEYLFQKSLQCQYTHIDETGADYCIYKGMGGKRLYIHHQWTKGCGDWLSNFDFAVVPYKDMGKKWRAHRGFVRLWKSVEDIVGEAISDPGIEEIVVVGYSQGGAIAQLCHEYCVFHRPDVKVYGFAFESPRVFWGRTPKERMGGCVVFRNGCDIVTHVPPWLFGFRFACDVLQINWWCRVWKRSFWWDVLGFVNCHTPENVGEALKRFDESK